MPIGGIRPGRAAKKLMPNERLAFTHFAALLGTVVAQLDCHIRIIS
jgi:hypothetical protein